jgi:hypothetical protein
MARIGKELGEKVPTGLMGGEKEILFFFPFLERHHHEELDSRYSAGFAETFLNSPSLLPSPASGKPGGALPVVRKLLPAN